MRRPRVTFTALLGLVISLALWGAAPADAHPGRAPGPLLVEVPAADPTPIPVPDERPLAWKAGLTPLEAPG